MGGGRRAPPLVHGTIGFSAEAGALWASSPRRKERFDLKGVNWFGAEGQSAVVDGLWQRPLTEYLDEIQRQRFNALRLPLAVDNVLNDPLVGKWLLTKNEAMRGRPASAHLSTLASPSRCCLRLPAPACACPSARTHMSSLSLSPP